jgi:hypothetical protein
VLLFAKRDAELHRRQLDVTFPAERVIEKAWKDPVELQKLPSNVRESVERLRRELQPEQRRPDWKAVRARRKRAESRIAAMERYATTSRCRRAELLRYFGESLNTCTGCDRHTGK